MNIVARDWRTLVEFYVKALGCERTGVERDLKADWISRATGVDATIRGQHLRLPGAQGVTLEIFTYDPWIDSGRPQPNRTGFGHIAFVVDDVPQALKSVLANGGSSLGEVERGEIEGAGTIEFVYCRDPEGNVIELQRWL